MTAEQFRRIPALYAQDGKGAGATAHVKFFAGGLTWFATEFDPETGEFFGYTVNHADLSCSEFGYFQAADLCAVQVPSVRMIGDGTSRGAFRLAPVVERDLHFTPCTLREAYRDLLDRDWPHDAPASDAEAAAVAEFDAA